MRAKFVVLANGILTTPKLARIDGMQSFAGDSFHTSLGLQYRSKGQAGWHYRYRCHSRTGCPGIGQIVEELYVFQRTPSSIDAINARLQ